ncbi:hypothetical protein EMCRGX_G001451 [Ephydatia muelleri]
MLHRLTPCSDLQAIFRELNALRKESKDTKQAIAHVQEAQAKMATTLNTLTEMSICIEKCPQKEQLNIEIATLFCKSLSRLPSNSDIRDMIDGIFGDQSSPAIRNKAKQYCKKRLTDLRSEERRRRHFMRTVPLSETDTYKQLRIWLKESYSDGLPPAEDLEEVVAADERIEYSNPHTNPSNPAPPEAVSTVL